MRVGENIRRYRIEAGLTQEALSKKVGVARSTVTLWECGRTVPRTKRIGLIAEVLQVNYADIMGEQDDARPLRSSTVPLFDAKDMEWLLPDSNAKPNGSTDEPITIEMQLIRSVEVPTSVLERHEGAVALLMQDDCMSRIAPKGMAVVFDPALEPANGQVVVLHTEEHGTIMRRWFRGSSNLMLVADSHSAYDDIVIPSMSNVRVYGTVVWVQSPYELD